MDIFESFFEVQKRVKDYLFFGGSFQGWEVVWVYSICVEIYVIGFFSTALALFAKLIDMIQQVMSKNYCHTNIEKPIIMNNNIPQQPVVNSNHIQWIQLSSHWTILVNLHRNAKGTSLSPYKTHRLHQTLQWLRTRCTTSHHRSIHQNTSQELASTLSVRNTIKFLTRHVRIVYRLCTSPCTNVPSIPGCPFPIKQNEPQPATLYYMLRESIKRRLQEMEKVR